MHLTHCAGEELHRQPGSPGVSMHYIQMMGRWKSDVVPEYLCAAPEELWQAAKALQQAT